MERLLRQACSLTLMMLVAGHDCITNTGANSSGAVVTRLLVTPCLLHLASQSSFSFQLTPNMYIAHTFKSRVCDAELHCLDVRCFIKHWTLDVTSRSAVLHK